MQSHKTISDIASTKVCIHCLKMLIKSRSFLSEKYIFKFKRMLNKELSHFAEHNKSDNQIAEFICNTYLGKFEVFFFQKKGSLLKLRN